MSNKIFTHLSGHESLVFFVISVVTFWFLWTFKNRAQINTEGAKVLPGPRGLPILGYLPYLKPNLHQLFMELAQNYGPIYKLSIGRKSCVIISSPTLAKEVVRDHDITFANRNPTVAALAFSYGGNDIAFAPYGREWRLLRRIFVQQMQSSANLDLFYPLRRREVHKSVTDLYNNKIGRPIHIGEFAFLTVINMISGMLWGGTIKEGLGDRIGAEFRIAVLQLTKVLGRPNGSDFFPILARWDLGGVEKEMKKVTGWIGNIYDCVIDERIKMMVLKEADDKMENRAEDFLQLLLKFEEQGTGSTISRKQIKGMLMDIVIGGTDTTTTTIEWAMAEMMLHPETMAKAQQELYNVVTPNDCVEEHHIQKLEYLQAIVKESLRLHPAAPLLLPRCPTKSCNIGGYNIPKGTKVFLNVWAMHRDTRFWDTPSEFKPERFLGEDGSKLDYHGNNLHYLPFGSGRRICAGLPLGEKMVMYVLATFLHMFDWKLPDGVEVDTSEKFGVVLEKSTPLIGIPVPRLSNLKLYVDY